MNFARKRKVGSWFSEEFGIKEDPANAHSQFTIEIDVSSADADGTSVKDDHTKVILPTPSPPLMITCLKSKLSFHVGPFETPSLIELIQRQKQQHAAATTSTPENALGGLTFTNIVGDVKELHGQADANSVFMVASQLNCLEMADPSRAPEHGITAYLFDRTQGPACALACAAGTLFRNYFSQGGRGQFGGDAAQIDTSRDMAGVLGNDKHNYWRVSNGYLQPSRATAMREVGDVLASDSSLVDGARNSLRVGVQWDTQVSADVAGEEQRGKRVAQVYCSALPVSYARQVPEKDFEPLGRLVLESAYESTLRCASLLARARKQRLTVYLTSLGGGAFGNPEVWIVDAARRALRGCAGEPVDVVMVHYGNPHHDKPPANSGWLKLESELGGESSIARKR